MFKIREEQLGALRKQSLSDGLIKSFDGAKQTASHDPLSGDVVVQDLKNNRTRFTFDKQGFVGGVCSPLGRVWKLENDGQGKLLALTTPAAMRLAFEYNPQFALSSLSRSDQKLFDLTYDDIGRLQRVAYPDRTATVFEYSGFSHISAITDRLKAAEKYKYNFDGDLVAITDRNGNQTTFEYEDWNRPATAHYPDGSSESYEYDPSGAVRRIVAGSEPLAEIEYGGHGQPLKITYSDGDVLFFEYNDDGKVIEARNSEGTAKYQYDNEGRVTEEDHNGKVIKYHYDESGTLIGMTYPSGEMVEFSYDADLRLVSVIDWNKGTYLFSYAADDRGIKQRTPNGLTTSIRQSEAGLPKSISVSEENSRGKELFSFSYYYDSEDRVQSFTDSGFGTRDYTYDAEGQLLSVETDHPFKRETFAYDAAGNRVHCNGEEAAFNVLNQLTNQGRVRCDYDARGNLVSYVTQRETWQYSYNSRNLLIRAEDGNGQIVTFGYDAFGRRIWKRNGTVETKFTWAGEHLISEVVIDGTVTKQQDYLYLPGTYTPLATRLSGEVYYYHSDHLGTPRRLTNSKGLTVWSADYSSFGQAWVTIESINNRLRLPGQYADEETGLHYNRFRYYSPELGRYLSRDPVTYFSGLNFYVYTGNDPINSSDPLGLLSWKTVVSVAAAVAVGVAVVLLAPVAAPIAIVAAGALAWAVGAGLNEALNQETLCWSCIFNAALKGAFAGTIAALPFVFLPASAGVLAYAGVGGLSGGLGYTADWFANYPDAKWSWGDFGLAVGAGAALAGAGRYLVPKISKARLKNYSQKLKQRNGGKNRVEMPGKRVDLDGKGHHLKDGTVVETPHTVDAKPPHPPDSPGAGRHPGYDRHNTRPATMEDLKEVDKFLKSQGK